MRFSGNKLFSVNLISILEILETSLLFTPSIPPYCLAHLRSSSVLSALQSWFLPMSSVCCDSPSLPFCQSARALWSFLNPPNNNRPLKKPIGILGKPSRPTKNVKLSISSLGSGQMRSSASASFPTYLHYFEKDQKSIAFRSIFLSMFEEKDRHTKYSQK